MGGGFDVVVVGARCAGSPVATMLARRGLSVCLLDKSRFPSEMLSTHVLQPCGVGILERLGVLDQVYAAGAAPLTRFSMDFPGIRVEARLDDRLFEHPLVSIRRVALDGILVEGAASAGVDVRTGVRVTGLLRENGRVAGVLAGGERISARLVIGADGRRSAVAELAGARKYRLAPPGRVIAWAYFEGVEPDSQLRLGQFDNVAYVGSATDNGMYMAAACRPMAEKAAFLADRERSYMNAIDGWPELAERVAGAKRDGPIRVLASWHGYFREPVGPGWVLVGDAGNFKDPTPAQGMADALRQAERLADSVVSGFGSDLDAELRRWGKWRDDDCEEMHWLATDMGSPDEMGPLGEQLLRDLGERESGGEEFLRLLNREITPRQLFSLRRVGRAAGRVTLRRPGQVPAMLKEGGRELRKGVRRATDRCPT